MKNNKKITWGYILVCAACINMALSCSADKNIDAALPLITIATQPTIPVAVCSGSGLQTISVSVPSTAGTVITYSWRKTGIPLVNGGIIAGQGTATLTLTNPGLADAGSYDVVVSNGSSSITSTAVVVKVNTLPTITTTTPGSSTGAGTVILGATASAGALNWYASATGGIPLGIGTSFITNNISATTTFYVEAVNLGCTSALRTPVIASVYSAVSTVVGAAGKTWMAYNLGATATATSATDYKQYGSLYEWGRGSDGHELITWTSATEGVAVNGISGQLSTTDTARSALFIYGTGDWRSPKNDALWQGVGGANNPCPSGYRLPTIAEWDAEIAASGIQSSNNIYSSPLKLVLAGKRFYSDYYHVTGEKPMTQGSRGNYWSSTVSAGFVMARLFTENTGTYSNISARDQGLSVRCLKD